MPPEDAKPAAGDTELAVKDAKHRIRRRLDVLTARKVLRDLLWTVTSPQVLSSAQHPVLPTEFGVDALQYDAVLEWLHAIEDDPTHLLLFLHENTRRKDRMLALGVYFSALLEYWLRFGPHLATQRFERGKQIVSATKQTVGQLKFLFRSSFPYRSTIENDGQVHDFHVESSVKFFLLNPLKNDQRIARDADPESDQTGGTLEGTLEDELEPVDNSETYPPLEQFVGPHLGENLAWRVQEVKRKLAMCRGESVMAWLREHYSEDVRSHIVLRGYLFYPLSQFASTTEVTLAHDWRFHPNPNQSDALPLDSASRVNPSIAPDHLRGWWTTDLEGELPGKVLANDQEAVGESRFVELPKLHWLSPVVALEDSMTGRVTVEGDADLGIPSVDAMTLSELIEFVRQHFRAKELSTETQTSGGVSMPLLVAEVVRYRQPQNDLATTDGVRRWCELSRGFILDPKSWDPSPLCHDAVRLRRTVRGGVSHSSEDREYEGRPLNWMPEGVIKPSDEELAARNELKRHAFEDPANVSPRQLCEELATVLGATKKSCSHSDLKRSTKEVLEATKQSSGLLSRSGDDATLQSQASEGVRKSAYLRGCLEFLVLRQSDVEINLARRVGYLLLDVFGGLKRESRGQESPPAASSEWVGLFRLVACEGERWEFLNLMLRAIDLTFSDSNESPWDPTVTHELFEVLSCLLSVRNTRWNAVVVEAIRIFRLGEEYEYDSDLGSRSQRPGMATTVRAVFDLLVEQHDWRNAEQLATNLRELAMLQTLYQQLSLQNMTKGLKRLRKVFASMHMTTIAPSTALAEHGGEWSSVVAGILQRQRSPPINHLRNRAITRDSVPPFKWQYVDSVELVATVVDRLQQLEAEVVSSTDETKTAGRVSAHRMLVGIDCEWRPQFLTTGSVSSTKDTHSSPDASRGEEEGSALEGDAGDIQDGLSIYQLAVGDQVFVVDVQILGVASSAPLRFIWRPTSRLVLVGFCVSSDLKRIERSFPDLVSRGPQNLDETSSLLVELKQLALFRGVPAGKWGLSKLYRVCIGDQVDKEHQCSDWGSRPLSYSQLVYAAKDAYAVRRLALHLLADASFPSTDGGISDLGSTEQIQRYLARFAANGAHSLPHWVATSAQPLGKHHVVAAVQKMGLTSSVEFLSLDPEVSRTRGMVVKSIALVVRSRAHTDSASVRMQYAVAVLELKRSIDMQAVGELLGVQSGEIALADQETLVRVFGYSRGCLGPLGLREQRAIHIVLDARLQTESRLLCGAGEADAVYSIAPDALATAVAARLADISI